MGLLALDIDGEVEWGGETDDEAVELALCLEVDDSPPPLAFPRPGSPKDTLLLLMLPLESAVAVSSTDDSAE